MDEKNTRQWHILHKDIERYEYLALIIKLAALITISLLVSSTISITPLLIIIGCFWLTEAIWRTFQARFEQRIIILEQSANDDLTSSKSIYSMYSDWHNSPRSLTRLLTEYLSSAIRPTVAMPYSILVLVSIFY